MRRGEIYYAGFPSLECCVKKGLLEAGEIVECEISDPIMDDLVRHGRLKELKRLEAGSVFLVAYEVVPYDPKIRTRLVLQ